LSQKQNKLLNEEKCSVLELPREDEYQEKSPEQGMANSEHLQVTIDHFRNDWFHLLADGSIANLPTGRWIKRLWIQKNLGARWRCWKGTISEFGLFLGFDEESFVREKWDTRTWIQYFQLQHATFELCDNCNSFALSRHFQQLWLQEVRDLDWWKFRPLGPTRRFKIKVKSLHL